MAKYGNSAITSYSGSLLAQDGHCTPIQKRDICYPSAEIVMEIPVTTDWSHEKPKRQMKSVVSVVHNFLPSDSESDNDRRSLKRPSSVLDYSHESRYPQCIKASGSRLSDGFTSERGSYSALLQLQPEEVLKCPPSTSSPLSGSSSHNVINPLNSCEYFTPNSRCSERIVLGHRRSLTYPRGGNRRSAADVTPYSPQSRFSESSPSSSFRRFKRMRTDFCIPSYDLRGITLKFPLRIVDTHCHLDFLFTREGYYGSYSNYRQVHSDTFYPGLDGCITIFCEPQNILNKALWDSLLQESGVWAAFGCHPHMVRSYNDETEVALIEALKDHKVVAIGEIGLDYSKRNSCDKQLQKKVFRQQLNIAVQHQRTLVVHCRDAHDDCIEIMKEMVPRTHFIHLHCFTDTWERVSEWLAEFPNLYVGVTNLVTFPTAENVHNIARKIPLERLLLETDTPYFVPRNVKSKWSHPGMVVHAAAQVAAFRTEISFQDLLQIMVPRTHFIHLHCFTDTERVSEWLAEFPNLYVGVTNLVTFPTAENVHNIARKILLQRLLLETDTPYFVPRNVKSKWSHPGMVVHAAAQVAAFRTEISLQDLLQIVRENTYRVYGI